MPRVIWHGEEHGSSVLTKAQVLEIRAKHVKSCPRFGASALARRFGVTPTTVHRIIHRKLWNHI